MKQGVPSQSLPMKRARSSDSQLQSGEYNHEDVDEEEIKQQHAMKHQRCDMSQVRHLVLFTRGATALVCFFFEASTDVIQSKALKQSSLSEHITLLCNLLTKGIWKRGWLVGIGGWLLTIINGGLVL